MVIDDLRFTTMHQGTLIHLPLGRGLTSLYGKNGAGKSRLLRAFSGVLTPEIVPKQDLSFLIWERGFLQVRMALADLDDMDSFEARTCLDLCHLAGPDDNFKLFGTRKGTREVESVKELRDEFIELARRQSASWGHDEKVLREALRDGVYLIAQGLSQVSLYLGTMDHTAAEGPHQEKILRPPGWDELMQGDLDGMAEEQNHAYSYLYGDNSPQTDVATRPSLPIRPERLGFSLPPGAALPLCYLGAIKRHPVGHTLLADYAHGLQRLSAVAWRVSERSDPFAVASSEAKQHRLAQPRRFSGVRVMVEPLVIQTLLSIRDAANLQLDDLLGPEAPKVELQAGQSPGLPISWGASLHGKSFPLNGLGDAHLRYAVVALEAAIRRIESPHREDQISMLLVDEPERATHPAAAARISEHLERLADYVVVATHSARVLDASNELWHVSNSDGSLTVAPLGLSFDSAARDRLSQALGMSLTELITLCRLIVLVEGEHDKAIIEAWCKDDLDAGRALVIPIAGTTQVPDLLTQTWLVAATEARFLLVLDDASADLIKDHRKQLSGMPAKAAHARRFAAAKNSRVLGIVDALFSAAIERKCLDRISVFGFKEKDIVRYLPVERVVAGFASWDEAVNAFMVSNGMSSMHMGDGVRFKTWVNNRPPRDGYKLPSIKRQADLLAKEWSANQTDQRPPEFKNLGHRIRVESMTPLKAPP